MEVTFNHHVSNFRKTRVYFHQYLTLFVTAITSIPGNGSASASPVVTPSTSKVRTPASPSNNAFDSILSELAGLKLEKTVRKATYTGGILSPTASAMSPLTPSSSTNALKTEQGSHVYKQFQ